MTAGPTKASRRRFAAELPEASRREGGTLRGCGLNRIDPFRHFR